MNAAFKEELEELEALEETEKGLEDVYYSDEDDLVANKYKSAKNQEDEDEDEEGGELDDDDLEESIEDIIRWGNVKLVLLNDPEYTDFPVNFSFRLNEWKCSFHSALLLAVILRYVLYFKEPTEGHICIL